VVDKNPLNFAHLGLIAALFPQARIVHCRRDPLDTALSIYFQNFAHPRNDYAYRIEDIAAMTGFHRRIMTYWERVLPIPIYPIDYERFVAEPEAQRRSVIEWLGLSWDELLLADSSAGAIHTASQWQARQPVYRHALGRARHYAPWIGPLSDALRSEGLADTGSAPRGSPE
ncbi:MAG TPA: sulfotransferase, partial [Gammaproteobacteria bacterium]|nr:sulfotransferase [Gammaproteobacteria bacterium]